MIGFVFVWISVNFIVNNDEPKTLFFHGLKLVEIKASVDSNYGNLGFYFETSSNELVVLNVKALWDSEEMKLYNNGIYYNCFLEIGGIYDFQLNRVAISQLDSLGFSDSYYHTTIAQNNLNTETDDIEVIRPKSDLVIFYPRLVEINDRLFIVDNISPIDNCSFMH